MHEAAPTVTDSDQADQSIEYEIVVWVMPAHKKSSSGHSRKKAPKVEPLALGPVTVQLELQWEDFLKILIDLLETEPFFLKQYTYEWCWLKLVNSPWLPLHTDAAYGSLIKQLKAPPCNVSGKYIIVHMAEPVKKPVNPGMVCSVFYF